MYGSGVTREEWQAVLADTMGLCAYCHARPKNLTLDHIDPVSKGGAHEPDNIVAVCKSCNSSKHVQSLVVWLALLANRRSRTSSTNRCSNGG